MSFLLSDKAIGPAMQIGLRPHIYSKFKILFFLLFFLFIAYNAEGQEYKFSKEFAFKTCNKKFPECKTDCANCKNCKSITVPRKQAIIKEGDAYTFKGRDYGDVCFKIEKKLMDSLLNSGVVDNVPFFTSASISTGIFYASPAHFYVDMMYGIYSNYNKNSKSFRPVVGLRGGFGIATNRINIDFPNALTLNLKVEVLIGHPIKIGPINSILSFNFGMIEFENLQNKFKPFAGLSYSILF